MSVENQTTYSTQTSAANVESSEVKKEELVVLADNKETGSELLCGDKESTKEETTTVDESSNPRMWLEGLSSVERAWAMGFVMDDAFLETLAAAGTRLEGDNNYNNKEQLIDWNKMVRIKELEENHLGGQADQSEVEEEILQGSENLSGDKETDDVEDEPVDSNALRIQNSSDLFNRLSVSFPSAFKHATGQDMGGPFVTLHPSTLDGQDGFRELDAISMSLLKRKFLVQDGLKADDALPLSAVVLTKLEAAVCLAHSKKTTIAWSSSMYMDLVSHMRALDDIAMTMDSGTLEKYLSPLSGSVNNTSFQDTRTMKLENISLMPINWVVGRSLQKLDGAVKSSLDLIANQGSDSSAPSIEARTTQAENETQSFAATAAEGKKESPSKKKKRKSKKKNKKKSASSSVSKVPAETGEDSKEEKDIEQEVARTDDAIESTEPELSDKEDTSPDNVQEAASSKPKEEKPVDVEDKEEVRRDDSMSVYSSDTSAASVEDKELAAKPEASSQGDITISRVEGVLRVSAPASAQHAPRGDITSTDIATLSPDAVEDDDDDWETVGQKVKGNRKKVPASGSTKATVSTGANGKTKSARTTASRKKVQNRKVARDIIASVLDNVEDQVKQKKKAPATPPRPAPQPPVNPWKVPVAPTRQPQSPNTSVAAVPKAKSLRDLVVEGRAGAVQSGQNRLGQVDAKASPRRDLLQRNKVSSAHRLKNGTSLLADQNTAPTYQETVSNVSSPSNAPHESNEGRNSSEEAASKTDSGSNVTDEAPQNRTRAPQTPLKMGTHRDPPLPTLLSPENANSATSSVASSLEVPHGGHRHHHASSNVDAGNVGCHLLEVCDRLSKDMALFMSRRNVALTERRRERGALLSSLQDTVTSLWSSEGRVQLYGSCATQLDLPSSDIDVVVVGLDSEVNKPQPKKSKKPSAPETVKSSEGKTMKSEATTPVPVSPTVRHSQYASPSARPNAQRVVRLAAELEKLPWVVQINAIPTASVPVIKILADPSRLAGASSASSLNSHDQELSARVDRNSDDEAARQQFNHQPWRGSDVMNGLLSLDITFEGPEHGGLGSTEFSAHAVAEACAESGLQPDGIPFVQTLMVLKELLVQRKLNEPYSGGLSSYALLLLVLGLIRERAAIKEELDHVEQQRRAMASIDSHKSHSTTKGTAGISKRPAQAWTPSQDSKNGPRKGVANVPDPSAFKQPLPTKPTPSSSKVSVKTPKVSSWASIARKTSGAVSKEGSSGQDNTPHARTVTPPQVKKPSFADAVAGSSAKAASRPQQKEGPTSAVQRDQTGHEQRGGVEKAARHDLMTQQSMETQPVRNSGQDISGVSSSNTARAPQLDPHLISVLPFYAQGFNDIVEVLCSGETTSGKLLMHFLLYYGEHFDAQSTSIDISGKHPRGYAHQMSPYPYLSPYIPRLEHGRIDPVTGMLTVDPIVVYDPLEGAENNNVARRCFAWNSVRWIFALSYATLSSAVERSATPPASPGGNGSRGEVVPLDDSQVPLPLVDNLQGDAADPSSSLLKCLLSF